MSQDAEIAIKIKTDAAIKELKKLGVVSDESAKSMQKTLANGFRELGNASGGAEAKHKSVTAKIKDLYGSSDFRQGVSAVFGDQVNDIDDIAKSLSMVLGPELLAITGLAAGTALAVAGIAAAVGAVYAAGEGLSSWALETATAFEKVHGQELISSEQMNSLTSASDTFIGIGEAVKGTFAAAIADAAPALEGLADAMAPVIMGLAEDLAPAITLGVEALGWLGDAMMRGIDATFAMYSAVWELLKAFGHVVSYTPLVGDALRWLGGVALEIGSAIGDTFRALAKNMQETSVFYGNIADKLGRDTFLGGLAESAEGLTGALGDLGTALVGGVSPGMEDAADKAEKLGANVRKVGKEIKAVSTDIVSREKYAEEAIAKLQADAYRLADSRKAEKDALDAWLATGPIDAERTKAYTDTLEAIDASNEAQVKRYALMVGALEEWGAVGGNVAKNVAAAYVAEVEGALGDVQKAEEAMRKKTEDDKLKAAKELMDAKAKADAAKAAQDAKDRQAAEQLARDEEAAKLSLLSTATTLAAISADASAGRIAALEAEEAALRQAGDIRANGLAMEIAAEKEKARRRAAAAKAIGLLEATVQATVAVIEASPNPLLMAAAGAAGAAGVAAIAATPLPTFHTGGMLRSHFASVLPGEAVLNRSAVASMGGEAGVNRINRRQPNAPQVTMVSLRGRVIDRIVSDAVSLGAKTRKALDARALTVFSTADTTFRST